MEEKDVSKTDIINDSNLMFPSIIVELLPAQTILLQTVNQDLVGVPLFSQIQICLKCLFSGKYFSCVQICQCCLDFLWEKLNTGNWKNVDMQWRNAYTLISLVKAVSQYCILDAGGDQSVTFEMIMKTIDMGLLMGASIHNNILSRLASTLQMRSGKLAENANIMKEDDQSNESHSEECTAKKLKIEIPSSQGLCLKGQIPRCECPSMESFIRDFYAKEEPCIITNAMSCWPCMSTRRWDIAYLRKRAGYRTVPVEVGSKYTDDTWTQSLMTVSEFIDKHIIRETNEDPIAYLAQHQLFDQIPELQEDIIIPDYCFLGQSSDVDINAWFGPRGTVSPLHYDPKHNFLAQVMGKKYIRVYSKTESDMVYPHSSDLLKNTSQVDVEMPDLGKFPQFQKAQFYECILKSGEMLYMPPKFWHFVKSLSISFSVSFWWE
ncbi:hypothetical protein ACJMK2_010406 [Sinanodonta woodiana]|uniref:JmjC domain-containing protein 5 n=1 Tax=Sinanodonta woodiana TaxID=1069815 RepID=A0ABD3VF92_SINWO